MGNLDAKRDWGHAKDFVNGIWKILQYHKPDDFVLATGRTYSVRDFVEQAFLCVDIQIKWVGKGLKEIGVNKENGNTLVKVDKRYYRPLEVNYLRGDSKKAERLLNWKCKISFRELVKEMVFSDLKRNKIVL